VFLREPQRVLQDRQQRLDQLEGKLAGLAPAALERMRQQVRQLQTLVQALRPDQQIQLWRRDHQHLQNRLISVAGTQLATKRERLLAAVRHLHLLSPQQTLGRGYSITRDASGDVIHHAAQVQPGAMVRTQFSDGEVISTVREVRAA
jgi:exodeoxyribonuclease VII large subunit